MDDPYIDAFIIVVLALIKRNQQANLANVHKCTYSTGSCNTVRLGVCMLKKVKMKSRFLCGKKMNLILKTS